VSVLLRQYECLKNRRRRHAYNDRSWPCCMHCGGSLYQDGHGLYVIRSVIREEPG
jgi:hypothetical protein